MQGMISPSTLVANTTAKAKRVVLDGKSYLVAPATIIVPGVLPGSKGPLLYESQDIELSTPKWDGMPLTAMHPYCPITGEHLSAKDSGVLDRQGIGFIKESNYKGKLRTNTYFDEERTRLIDPTTYQSLLRGQPIELSTGLYTQNEPAPIGSRDSKGRPYTHIARHFQPDHLAVLQGQKGACSLSDGCGVLVNKRGEIVQNSEKVLVFNCAVDWGVIRNTQDVGGKTVKDTGMKGTVLDPKVRELETRAKYLSEVASTATRAAASGNQETIKEAYEANKKAWKAHEKCALQLKKYDYSLEMRHSAKANYHQLKTEEFGIKSGVTSNESNKFYRPENYDKIRDLPNGLELWSGGNDWESGTTWAGIHIKKTAGNVGAIRNPGRESEPIKWVEISHKDCPGCHGDLDAVGKENNRLCRDFGHSKVEEWLKSQKIVDNGGPGSGCKGPNCGRKGCKGANCGQKKNEKNVGKKQAGFNLVQGVRSVKKSADHEYTGTKLVTLDNGDVHPISFDRQSGFYFHGNHITDKENHFGMLGSSKEDALNRLVEKQKNYKPNKPTSNISSFLSENKSSDMSKTMNAKVLIANSLPPQSYFQNGEGWKKVLIDNEEQYILTLNPFVNDAQRKACYAQKSPDWDCDKWEKETKKVDKARVLEKKPTTNSPSLAEDAKKKIGSQPKSQFEDGSDELDEEDAPAELVGTQTSSDGRDIALVRPTGGRIAGEGDEDDHDPAMTFDKRVKADKKVGYSVPVQVGNAWSDEAREASIAARKSGSSNVTIKGHIVQVSHNPSKVGLRNWLNSIKHNKGELRGYYHNGNAHVWQANEHGQEFHHDKVSEALGHGDDIRTGHRFVVSRHESGEPSIQTYRSHSDKTGHHDVTNWANSMGITANTLINNAQKCPECGGEVENGVCQECGYEIEEELEEENEDEQEEEVHNEEGEEQEVEMQYKNRNIKDMNEGEEEESEPEESQEQDDESEDDSEESEPEESEEIEEPVEDHTSMEEEEEPEDESDDDDSVENEDTEELEDQPRHPSNKRFQGKFSTSAKKGHKDTAMARNFDLDKYKEALIANCSCDEHKKIMRHAIMNTEDESGSGSETDQAGGEEDSDDHSFKSKVGKGLETSVEVGDKKFKGKKNPVANSMSELVANYGTPQEQEAWHNAMQINNEARNAIINRLVSNVQDTEKKKSLIKNFRTKSISELRDFLAIQSPASMHQPVANYFGSSAPSLNHLDDGDGDILELPTMSFNGQAE